MIQKGCQVSAPRRPNQNELVAVVVPVSSPRTTQGDEFSARKNESFTWCSCQCHVDLSRRSRGDLRRSLPSVAGTRNDRRGRPYARWNLYSDWNRPNSRSARFLPCNRRAEANPEFENKDRGLDAGIGLEWQVRRNWKRRICWFDSILRACGWTAAGICYGKYRYGHIPVCPTAPLGRLP